QTELCEGACPYMKQGRPPVPIGRLEAFAADWALRHGVDGTGARALPKATGRRAAVVGAGPAGLAVAAGLARKGHAVTLFDARPDGGGLLRFGIPGFKLDPAHARRHTDAVRRLGVRCRFGTRLGADVTLEELVDEGFEAAFLGIGAGRGRPLDVEGADLAGVVPATPFLLAGGPDAAALPDAWDGATEPLGRVAVIGGGDTAMDCLRTAVRLGAHQAVCWYRRTESEMPGNPRDRALAREEGARFEWLAAPVRLHGDAGGRVRAMTLVDMRLGEPDASGRRRPEPVAGSERIVDVDTVVLALGYLPDAGLVGRLAGVETEPDGRIRIDPATGATSRAGVYAGGDAVLGPALVVDALAHARRAVESMHRFLAGGGSLEPA
ncbi:MAG: FAD-dependent oxidoreductase, partial [Gemmatimonadota bacterium]|nr:FAD-dependent oxidoreductase [Gemmatimonadota bacterium]